MVKIVRAGNCHSISQDLSKEDHAAGKTELSSCSQTAYRFPSLARARLSCRKERVWSNCILRFVLSCPINPWRVHWFIYRSDVLWLPAEGARESWRV